MTDLFRVRKKRKKKKWVQIKYKKIMEIIKGFIILRHNVKEVPENGEL